MYGHMHIHTCTRIYAAHATILLHKNRLEHHTKNVIFHMEIFLLIVVVANLETCGYPNDVIQAISDCNYGVKERVAEILVGIDASNTDEKRQ